MDTYFWELGDADNSGLFTSRYLRESHFIVSCRCFWSHLPKFMESRTTLLESLGKHMRREGSCLYFLDHIYAAPWGDRSTSAVKLLKICASYSSGMAKAVSEELP